MRAKSVGPGRSLRKTATALPGESMAVRPQIGRAGPSGTPMTQKKRQRRIEFRVAAGIFNWRRFDSNAAPLRPTWP